MNNAMQTQNLANNVPLPLYRTRRMGLLVLCLLWIVATAGGARLYGQSQQYENLVIEKIDIVIENLPEGAEFDMNSVKSRIKTREGDFFSQTEFDNDLKTLARDFDHVEPLLQLINGKLYITLKIWPKPTIRCIRWNGNRHIETKCLQKELAIKHCTVFDRLAFNKAFHKLKAYYIKQGFFEAELNYTVTSDPCTNEVDIDICINEGRAGRIKQIVLCGFTSKEENEILEEMVTKEYNILLSWYTNEGTYHEEAIQQDQFTIINYLQNEGYADARVKIEVAEVCNNRINVYITAEKGEIYRFGELSICGNTLFPDEAIWRQFRFCQGSPYSPEKLRETLRNISNLYGRRGFIDANVDFEPSLACDSLTYNVKFTIEEGDQFRVGLIKVFGNCSTQTNVILHESLLVPGEIFNIEKLQKTEERLKNIGYFKNVNVYAVKSAGPLGLGECFRDVHIEVEETSTGHFGAFVGFSTSESVFGGINITERNFNYKGLGRFWNEGYKVLRGGGEYAHFTATIGAKSRKYIFSWTKPFFMDTPWSVGFDIENSSNRYISNDYDINAWGFTLHATYQINQFLRFGTHYRLRKSDVEVSGEVKEHRIREEIKAKGLISAVGYSLMYDATDHPTCPRSGFRSRADIELAGVGGASAHRFLGLAYLNAYYLPLGEKSVMKYRADFRFLLPIAPTKFHTIPLDERLFLGGDSEVRGYRPYKLGPEFPGTDDQSGGISLQFYSVEFARKLHKRVEGFTYFDAGWLGDTRFTFHTPYAAVGIGARVKVLDSIPPLMLGMGYPLNAKSRGQVKRFFLTVGGQF